jgi:hypothetical protein
VKYRRVEFFIFTFPKICLASFFGVHLVLFAFESPAQASNSYDQSSTPNRRPTPEEPITFPASTLPQSDDIRNMAPARPDSRERDALAMPQSGHDLQSVSKDWLGKQTRLLTGGSEEKIVESMNKKLNQMLQGRAKSADDGATQKSTKEVTPNKRNAQDETLINQTLNVLRPSSFRFATPTRFEFDFGGEGQWSCSHNGAGLEWDYQRAFTKSIDLNFKVKPAAGENSLNLNYSW